MHLQPFIIEVVAFTVAVLLAGSVARLFLKLHRHASLFSVASWVPWLLAVAVLLISLPLGMGLPIPDSAEYFGVAARMLFDGTTALSIEGVDVPSRYAPWFSWFMLYPGMRLGGDVYSAVVATAFFSLVGIASASALARGLLGTTRAELAAWIGTAILIIPAYRYFSVQVMTDVPAAALMVLLAAVFIASVTARYGILDLFAIGVVVAVAGALRPLCLFALVPFIARYRASGSFAALCGPALVLVAATGWYNLAVFGSLLRSGYNLWTAVPYDYWWLVFSFGYLSKNVSVLLAAPIFLPMLLVSLLPSRFFHRRLSELCCVEKELRTFVLMAILPIVLIHLFYFYQSTRFFLPLEVILTVSALSRLSSIVPSAITRIVVGFVVFATAFNALTAAARSEAHREGAVLEVARRCSAENALLISSIHPVHVYEKVARGTRRVVVPLSRKVELASKLLTLEPVPYPSHATNDPFEHRATWLQGAGGKEAFELVALEDLKELRSQAASGTQVVVLDFRVHADEREALQRDFMLQELCPGVQQLIPLADNH